MSTSTLSSALLAVVEGNHANPHEVLGRHGDVVRIWQPGAAGVRVDGGEAEMLHPAGLFVAKPAGVGPHTFVVVRPDGFIYAASQSGQPLPAPPAITPIRTGVPA